MTSTPHGSPMPHACADPMRCTICSPVAGAHFAGAPPVGGATRLAESEQKQDEGKTENFQKLEPELKQSEHDAPLGLWVDDSKPAPPGCAVARTYDDALRMMRRFRYATLYLDHDLGEPRTGYDLLLQVIAEGCVPPTLECISWNPVGRQRIAAAWGDYCARNAAAGSVVLASDPSWSIPQAVDVEALTAARLSAEQETARLRITERRLRHAGGLLANVAYNLAQRSTLTENQRRCLDESRQAWDAEAVATRQPSTPETPA